MAKRTFEVEVVITVEVDGDEYAARAEVDDILQHVWNRDHEGELKKRWHFELLDGGLVTDITEEES